MEGQSDKSSAMSDSGGLIDLSGVSTASSETPASKNGGSSLEKSKKDSGNQSGGEGSHCGGLKQEKKRVYHPSEEMWLADMDAEMNGVKLIGEEEFDFDIPEEYLNISFEPVHHDSLEENPNGTTAGDAAEEPTTSKSEEDQSRDRDESFQLLSAMTVPAPEQFGVIVGGLQTGNSLPPAGEDSCLPGDESRRKSSSPDSGVSGVSGVSAEEGERAVAASLARTQEKRPTPGNLISFTPWVAELQGSAGEGGATSTSVGASPSLTGAVFPGGVVHGEQCCGESPSAPPITGSSPTLESSSSGQNHSRIPTPKKQLRKCSVFNNSPVKCSQLEDMRSVSREGDSLLHRLASETIIVAGSIAATTAIVPSSSSCETFIISDSSANRDGEREKMDSENQSDSTFSCLPQASTARRESRDFVSAASHPAQKTGALPRASSKSKLTKLSSKSSLLPSKSTSALQKVKRRPTLAKPGTVASTKGSQLPNPPPSFKPSIAPVHRDTFTKPSVADEGKEKVSSRLRPVRAMGKAARPAAKTRNAPASRLPSKGIGGLQCQQSGPKSELTPRRNSNPATLPASNPPQVQPIPTNVSLSTSIMSTCSPSVQQSTPIKTAAKATAKRKVVPLTPKAPVDSTPEISRATFSFSSIEGGSSCVKQPVVARLPTVPDASETSKYVGSEGEGHNTTIQLQTPRSSKKRRSFIPTPGGQERAAPNSPIPYDINALMATKEDGGGVQYTRGTSPMLNSPKMPPPKARKVLNPRMRPSGLQRLRGGRPRGVFAVRQPTAGGSRQEGPLKAKRTFPFGRNADFDDSEFPIPRTKVVHSPLGQENQVTTPHSEWSPIRKKPVSADEACFQCTKKGRV